MTDVWIAFLSFVELISLTDRSCIVMEMMEKMFMTAILRSPLMFDDDGHFHNDDPEDSAALSI